MQAGIKKNVLRALRRIVFLRLMRLPRFAMERAVGELKSVDGRTLDLQTAFMLRLVALEKRPAHTKPVSAQRAEIDTMGPAGGGPPRPVRIEERTLEANGADLRVRIYRPLSYEGRLPILVFYHGGGFVIGSLESHDRPCRVLSDEARCIVVSVDYRLAPEHKFPAALDDALFAFQWVESHAA